MHSHDRGERVGGGGCREWGWGEEGTVSTGLRKEMFLDYILNESREAFCRRGRGRLFHVDGPKTEKALEPTVESLVRGIWRLIASEAERRVREGV